MVLDASFRSSAARRAERALAPSESDGRAQIFDDFALRYEPISELSEREHVVLDTSDTPAESLVRLRRAAVV